MTAEVLQRFELQLAELRTREDIQTKHSPSQSMQEQYDGEQCLKRSLQPQLEEQARDKFAASLAALNDDDLLAAADSILGIGHEKRETRLAQLLSMQKPEVLEHCYETLVKLKPNIFLDLIHTQARNELDGLADLYASPSTRAADPCGLSEKLDRE